MSEENEIDKLLRELDDEPVLKPSEVEAPGEPKEDSLEDADYVKGDSSSIVRCMEHIDLVFGATGGKGFICGGFARYAMSPLDSPVIPSDIDLYCFDEPTYNDIIDALTKDERTVRRKASRIETKFDIVLSGGGYNREILNLQVIRPFTIMNMVSDGDALKILQNFDFTIAKCAILPDMTTLSHVDFLDHEQELKLVVYNIHCPISSLKRIIKYTNRGYMIESVELLKLFEDYESRSPAWKELIHRGLNEKLDGKELALFVETMYMD